MDPDQRSIVEGDGGEVAETFPQAGDVLATAQGVDGKPRQKHEKANRQKQTVEEIHRLEFKTLVCLSAERNLKVEL